MKADIDLRDALKWVGPHSFVTMLKPFGSTCNLECDYCYYWKRGVHNSRPMSFHLLEIAIRQSIEANDTDHVTFCWHGGEPTLLGLDYFKTALQMQGRYANGKVIENTLQTNGMMVDERWCDFFAQNHFLVGLSIDGPRSVQDTFRRAGENKSTFDHVMKTVDLFHRYGVQFNTLSAVSKVSEGRGKEIYLFLRDAVHSRVMQFLPVYEHFSPEAHDSRPSLTYPGQGESVPTPWSVSDEGYGRFLCDVFDEWISHRDGGQVFVQLFDATLAGYLGVSPGVCLYNETCGDVLSIDSNGDVYPCDHFTFPEFKLGNIQTLSLRKIFESGRRLQFGLNKKHSLPRDCMVCHFQKVCHGECPKHWYASGMGGEHLNALCKGLKLFFAHADETMNKMANFIKMNYSTHLP